MKRLLVPVDFSEQSVSAFRLALDIARRSKGMVSLLHVISLPALHESPLMPVGGLKKEFLLELKDVAEKKLDRLVRAFNPAAIKVRSYVVPGGVHSAILHFIRAESIDMVIMGTKGATGMREWVIGSNTEKIVRTSPVPIMAVKNYPNGRPIKNIVFPNTLDTENQELLIMKVKALQDFFKAKLHIIWVNTPAVSKPEPQVRKELKAFAQRFMLKDYTVNVFNYTNEEAGIIEFTNQVDGDLIAMGTRGTRGIAHFFTGSVAEDIVNHVRYPVWTFCTKPAKNLSTQKNPS